jgi:hypothetical protein
MAQPGGNPLGKSDGDGLLAGPGVDLAGNFNRTPTKVMQRAVVVRRLKTSALTQLRQAGLEGIDGFEELRTVVEPQLHPLQPAFAGGVRRNMPLQIGIVQVPSRKTLAIITTFR